MMNREIYMNALDALFVCAVTRLMMEANDLDTITACTGRLYDFFNIKEEQEEAEREAMELPEISLEEAAEQLFFDHLDQWGEECKELAYQDFERRGVSREKVNAYLAKHDTAHKVGA
ncbi:hypothetical protein [Klebsiella variicola]|uniref:hypothetical protein n=1 Tax=Klebsiella variicola TaxID=244366 RepID=UPI003D01ACDC